MPKSTPITQLPFMGNTDVANEKQKNVPTMPYPIDSTYTSSNQNEIEDNEEEINKVLSQFPPSTKTSNNMNLNVPPVANTTTTNPQSSIPRNINSYPQTSGSVPEQFPPIYQQNYDDNGLEPFYHSENDKNPVVGYSMFSFGNITEIKRSVLVMIIFAIVAGLPIENLFKHYIPTEKQTIYILIIKAILSGLLFYILINIV